MAASALSQETNFYWDGKILKGEDGKYHLYASHWAYSNGFGPPAGASGTGWQSSIPMQAVSDNVMGPYVSQGDCYTRNQEGNNKGHNTTALVTPTGAAPYTLSVGEIVAGQMFSASSANGPWTLLGLTKTNTNGHNGCGTLSSNFTFTVGPDNRFWATSRSGCIMDSDQVLRNLQSRDRQRSAQPREQQQRQRRGRGHLVQRRLLPHRLQLLARAARVPHHVEERHDELDEHGPRLPGYPDAGQRELELAPVHGRHRQPVAQHGAGERLPGERPRHPFHLRRHRRGQEQQRPSTRAAARSWWSRSTACSSIATTATPRPAPKRPAAAAVAAERAEPVAAELVAGGGAGRGGRPGRRRPDRRSGGIRGRGGRSAPAPVDAAASPAPAVG